MRRLGGFVFAMSLVMMGCVVGDNVADRSAGPVDTAPVATTDTTTDASTTTETAPAPDDDGDDVGDAATPPSRSTPAEVAADNPVLVGASVPTAPAASVRAQSAGPQPTGRIEIPAIGLSHATYEGVSLSVINHGPSWWPGTARPGHKGNTVFPGHRTTYSRPFYNINNLRAGDEVIFTTSEGRFVYQVKKNFIVSPTDTWIVDQTSTPTFTIFACHPRGSANQRVVVTGSLVSAPATTTTTTTTTTTVPPTTTTAPKKDGLIGWLFG